MYILIISRIQSISVRELFPLPQRSVPPCLRHISPLELTITPRPFAPQHITYVNICIGRISTSNVLRIFNTNKGGLYFGGEGGGEKEKSLNVNPSLAKSKPSNQAMRGQVGGREKSGILMLTPINNKMLK